MELFGVKYSKVFVADMQIMGSAFFFGIGFIGQRAVSVEGLGPMTCNMIRFGLSAILLMIAMPIMPSLTENIIQETSDDDDDNDKTNPNYEKKIALTSENSTSYVISRLIGNEAIVYFKKAKKTVIFWGIFLGFVNFFASGFQQWGITMTSANKVAFIAGFDLFLTPVLALFLPTFKRNGKPQPSTWIAVSISIFGLYLLSNANISELDIGHGEVLCLISTVFWTLHITYTDVATNYVDCMQMMCVQLTVVSLISMIFAFCFEPQGWFFHQFLAFLPWLIFLAISEGLAFTLMAMGQNYSPPTHAAIILSLEGVFASIASYFCLGETLDNRELLGCIMMLVATLVAKMGCPAVDRPPGGPGAHGHAHGHSHNSNAPSPVKHDIECPQGNSIVTPLVELTTATAVPVVSLMNGVLNLVLVPIYQIHKIILSFGSKAKNSANTQVHSEITPDDTISGSDLPLMHKKHKESSDVLSSLSGNQ